MDSIKNLLPYRTFVIPFNPNYELSEKNYKLFKELETAVHNNGCEIERICIHNFDAEHITVGVYKKIVDYYDEITIVTDANAFILESEWGNDGIPMKELFCTTIEECFTVINRYVEVLIAEKKKRINMRAHLLEKNTQE